MENPKDKLRQVVEEYWRKELPKTVERKIILKTESDLINDIIAPRRGGKTFLMFSTIQALLEGGVIWIWAMLGLMGRISHYAHAAVLYCGAGGEWWNRGIYPLKSITSSFPHCSNRKS